MDSAETKPTYEQLELDNLQLRRSLLLERLNGYAVSMQLIRESGPKAEAELSRVEDELAKRMAPAPKEPAA